jgi:hypothetical protein
MPDDTFARVPPIGAACFINPPSPPFDKEGIGGI